MFIPSPQLFRIAQVHDSGTSTLLDGSDDLVRGVRLDAAAFSGARVLVLDSIGRRHEVTCVRLTIGPTDVGQRLVIDVVPRISSDALVGGAVMVEPHLVPRPS